MRYAIAIAVCFTFGGCAVANGPAWIAELSDTSPAHSDAISVTIPVGSHVALAIHNTDAVDPQCPPGIEATVRVMWFEHRTIFAGRYSQREASIPYYLPEPKDCAPTGSWVVELLPATTGTFKVPISCNSNTVTATIDVIDLPQSDIGYGFYTDHHRFPDLSREAEYDRDMAAHGMNTFTPYAREVPFAPGIDQRNSAQLLAWHINTAIMTGLCDRRFPLMCLSINPEQLAAAKQYAEYDWPELIGYNHDEPSEDKRQQVAEYAEAWHKVGARTGTAISGDVAQKIGGPLDVWIIHMDSMSETAIAACEANGSERWLYNCALRGSNAALHRYWAGVYTWAQSPRVALTWTYTHDPESRIKPDGTWDLRRVYDTATCDAEGHPIPTVAIEGLQEGIIDSRLLQELARRNTTDGNAYLSDLRKQVEVGFWRDGRNRENTSGYVWDEADTQVPPVNCCKVRKDVLRLLKEGE